MKVRYDHEQLELNEVDDQGNVEATIAPDEIEGMVIAQCHRDGDGRLVLDLQSPE